MQSVLTIAGFDPSSGAGVTADLMVFAAHGLFGTSCITALTVQSTVKVKASHPVAPDIVRATLEELQEDLPPAGIKIGMLATAEIVAVVADFLARNPSVPVVLDPVLRSSSGRELLPPAGVVLMRELLLPLVGWVTPNLDELAILTGGNVTTHEEMVEAGRNLRERYPALTVLATGGHLERPDDLLLTLEGGEDWLPGESVATRSTHGTGCALSSALLSQLVLGDSAGNAALSAKRYVAETLRTATARGRGRVQVTIFGLYESPNRIAKGPMRFADNKRTEVSSMSAPILLLPFLVSGSSTLQSRENPSRHRSSVVVRRRPDMQQGRALEMLGHAIEYLIDSRVYLLTEPNTVADSNAIQILSRSSREVFAMCVEIVPAYIRFKQWAVERLHVNAHHALGHTPARRI